MKNITLNFGAIRDSISRLSSMEILKENNSGTLKNFIKKVKKNPVLFKQHIIFKNFEDVKPFKKERLAERFILQNLSLLDNISWQDILKENKDIRITLLENSHVESNGSKKNDLFNHIHTLIEAKTKKGFSNIEKEQESYEFLLEYLTREEQGQQISEEKDDKPNFNNWEFITKLAVDNFNERYSHLNESERNILKKLLSSSDKKINHIQDLKEENLEIIDNILESEKNKENILLLEGFKNKLNKDEISGFDYDDYVIAYSELNESLKELKK